MDSENNNNVLRSSDNGGNNHFWLKRHHLHAWLNLFIVGLLLLPILRAGSASLSTDTNAVYGAPGQAVPKRLAILGFAALTDDPDVQRKNKVLTDLLTVKLSQEKHFELLERGAIEVILKEITLSKASTADDAIRVGALMHADWLAVGAILQNEGGPAVVVKLLDARTGIIRDLTAIPLDWDDLTFLVNQMAAFLNRSANAAPDTKQHIFVGIGGFEDLSINNLYPDFRQNLKAALEKNDADNSLTFVERTMVDPLLTELRLNLGGLAADSGLKIATAQPAFFLVDGVYQSYRDERSRINLVLRIARIGGAQRVISLNESPGRELNTKIAEAIKTTIKELSGDNPAISQKSEALVQLDRGKDRARFPEALNYPSELGGYWEGEENEKRLKNISEAVEAFKAVLLLDPDDMESRLYLGVCLIAPGIGKKDSGRDYLREVVAGTTNVIFVRQARKYLAQSYEKENDAYALELIQENARVESDSGEKAAILDTMCDPMERLHRFGQLSGEDGAKLYEKLYLAEREVDRWAATNHVRFKTNPNNFTYFRRIMGLDEAEKHLETFLPTVAEKYPDLAPYIWISYTIWRSYQETPVPAAVLTHLKDALVFCRENPDKMANMDFFYTDNLPEILNWSVAHQDRDLGEIIGSILRQNESAQIHEAFAYASQSKWRDALNIYEGLRNSEDIPRKGIRMDLDGPWGKKGTVVDIDEKIAECRQHLGFSVIPYRASVEPVQSTNTPPTTFTLGSPVVTTGQPIIFRCDGDQIWLVDGFLPFVYQKKSGRLEEIEWPEGVERRVTTIRAGKTKVWWATEGSGLVELDKQTGRFHIYTEKDGLLLNQIRTLDLTSDRLWMGFGRLRTGGIGYLDLKTQSIVGFTTELDSSVVQNRTNNDFLANRQKPDAPPRQRVIALSQVASNDLWFVAWDGLSHDSINQNSWTTIGSFVLHDMWAVAGNSEYVVVGGERSMGGENDPGGLQILIPPNKWEEPVNIRKWLKPERLKPRFLPHPVTVSSLAIDGEKIWAGGHGFLVLVDLKSKQVEKLCDFDDREIVVGCLQIEGDKLWVGIGNELYCIPKNGQPAH